MSQVLIIEDEIQTAAPVKEALQLEGISADIAPDGETGLKMLDKGMYDLVLLDLKMPGMTGEEVLSQIRKTNPFVDVIIYTNYSEFADIKKLANIGIDGYINKGPNADLSELLEKIKKTLAPLDDAMVDTLLRAIPDNPAGE